MGGSSWGFLALSQDGAPLIRDFASGNYANTMTFSELVKALENQGWQYGSPSDLPAWLTTALASPVSFLANFSGYTITPFIMVIPGGMLDTGGYWQKVDG
jgi:hypothetical protein